MAQQTTVYSYDKDGLVFDYYYNYSFDITVFLIVEPNGGPAITGMHYGPIDCEETEVAWAINLLDRHHAELKDRVDRIKLALVFSESIVEQALLDILKRGVQLNLFEVDRLEAALNLKETK